MKISVLFKTIFLGLLLISPLNAQGIDDSPNCYEKYNLCSVNCESLENGIDECVTKCDEEDEKCSALENNPTEDSELTSPLD